MNQNMRNIDWSELSQASRTLVLGNYARDMEQVVYGHILDCINQGGKIRILSFNNRLGALCNALNGSYFKPTIFDLSTSSILGGIQKIEQAITHASAMIFHELGPMGENERLVLMPYVTKAVELAVQVAGADALLGDVIDSINFLANRSQQTDPGLREALGYIAAFLCKSMENGYVFWHGQTSIPDDPFVMYDAEYLMGNIPEASAFILSFLLRSMWDTWASEDDSPRMLVIDDVWKLKACFPSRGVASGVLSYLVESSNKSERILFTTFGSQAISDDHTLDRVLVNGIDRKIFTKSLFHENLSAVSKLTISPGVVAGISSHDNEFIMLMVDKSIDAENSMWLTLNLNESRHEHQQDTMTATGI